MTLIVTMSREDNTICSTPPTIKHACTVSVLTIEPASTTILLLL